jgi:hypothetical protein
MLASIINQDGDIQIFLSDEEIEILRNNPLKGEIFEFMDVRKIYPLEILLEKSKKNMSFSFGIRREINNDKYSIYISDIVILTSYYENLKEKRWIGTRDGFIKIDIMTENYATKNEQFSRDYRFIKSRYENRDKIIEKMIREGL